MPITCWVHTDIALVRAPSLYCSRIHAIGIFLGENCFAFFTTTLENIQTYFRGY
jgi:hypothetical protein